MDNRQKGAAFGAGLSLIAMALSVGAVQSTRLALVFGVVGAGALWVAVKPRLMYLKSRVRFRWPVVVNAYANPGDVDAVPAALAAVTAEGDKKRLPAPAETEGPDYEEKMRIQEVNRIWMRPGGGEAVVNEMRHLFDMVVDNSGIYWAELLRPFSERLGETTAALNRALNHQRGYADVRRTFSEVYDAYGEVIKWLSYLNYYDDNRVEREAFKPRVSRWYQRHEAFHTQLQDLMTDPYHHGIVGPVNLPHGPLRSLFDKPGAAPEDGDPDPA